MSVDRSFAIRGILILWLGAIGIVAYKEYGNPKNVDKPFPRPCKLIPPSIGYTGIAIMAEFAPTVAFALALALAVSEVVQTQGLSQTIFDQLANSIQKENQAVAKAG